MCAVARALLLRLFASVPRVEHLTPGMDDRRAPVTRPADARIPDNAGVSGAPARTFPTRPRQAPRHEPRDSSVSRLRTGAGAGVAAEAAQVVGAGPHTRERDGSMRHGGRGVLAPPASAGLGSCRGGPVRGCGPMTSFEQQPGHDRTCGEDAGRPPERGRVAVHGRFCLRKGDRCSGRRRVAADRVGEQGASVRVGS
jgi:hypothetical protein